MARIRAWRVRAGDVLLSPVFDYEVWRWGGYARPLIDERPFRVTRVRPLLLRLISPAFEIAGADGSTGGMGGYGPLDWVTVQDQQAA